MKQPFRRLPLILIVFVSVLFSVKYGVRFIGPKAYWAAGIISLFYAALATIGPSLFNKLNKFKYYTQLSIFYGIQKIFIASLQ